VSQQPIRATVVGAGAWGTALATVLAQGGHEVILWCFEQGVAESINQKALNPYLEGVSVPKLIRAETDLEAALRGARVIVSASPAQFVRGVMGRAGPHVEPDAIVVSASKGIELGSLLRMDEVLAEVLPESAMRGFAVLSGPSFAQEVATGQPTAVVIASRNARVAARAQDLFQTPSFRVYTNADVIGVELAGALKNVIALAAGTTAGLGFGHNTTAALITRGLAEITRLGVAVGADKATFYGLAGLGDLVLTCTGSLSRNRAVGYRLGQGESLQRIVGEMTAIAEGVETTRAAFELSRRVEVEMPIIEQMYAILYEGRAPADALRSLMSRDPKPEEWS
jgi:glycerol-3-phosphate dehydrogenase (NAD(P)+)